MTIEMFVSKYPLLKCYFLKCSFNRIIYASSSQSMVSRPVALVVPGDQIRDADSEVLPKPYLISNLGLN